MRAQKRSRLPVLMAAAVVGALAAGAPAVGQSTDGAEPVQPVAVESAVPAWRDLERAQEDLRVALSARDISQMAIDRTVGDLGAELARLDRLNDDADGRRLLEQEAQKLVVQEYMAGGDLEDLAFVLEVGEATHALWRKALLSEVSEVVDEALKAVGNVPGERERAEARVARLEDAVQHLNSRLAGAQSAVQAAEWVVYIAEINDLADRELAANGFVAPTEQQWYNLRFCESTNNYTVESANGLFYGAYQFEPRTWRTVGGTGNPAHAPPEEQDARARLLYARRGDQPWPRDYCGRWLPRN